MAWQEAHASLRSLLGCVAEDKTDEERLASASRIAENFLAAAKAAAGAGGDGLPQSERDALIRDTLEASIWLPSLAGSVEAAAGDEACTFREFCHSAEMLSIVHQWALGCTAILGTLGSAADCEQHQRHCGQLLLGPGTWLLQVVFAAPSEALRKEACIGASLNLQLQVLESLLQGARTSAPIIAGGTGIATRAAAEDILPPVQLLNWLSLMATSMGLVMKAATQAECQQRLARIAMCVCDSPLLRAHRQSWQQQTSLMAAVAGQLASALQAHSVAAQLPAEQQPKWFSWPAVRRLALPLLDQMLGPALEAWLGSVPADTKLSLLGPTAKLVQLVPLAGQAGSEASELAFTQSLLCELLYVLCVRHGAGAQDGGRAAPLALQRQLAATLLPVVPALQPMLQHALLVSGGSVEDGSGQPGSPALRTEAPSRSSVWENIILMTGCLCKLSPAPRSKQVPGSPDEMREWDCHDCSRYGGLPAALSSMTDAVQWCQAACAALRNLPLLASLAARPEFRAEQLAWSCVALGTNAAKACLPLAGLLSRPQQSSMFGTIRVGSDGQLQPIEPQPGLALDRPAAQAFQEAMWQLHSVGCRLVCWAAQSDSAGGSGSSGSPGSSSSSAAEKPGGEGRPQPLHVLPASWRGELLALLTATLSATRLMQQLCKGLTAANPDVQYDSFFQGMCAASWEVLQLLVHPMPPAEVDFADLARCLAAAVAGGPPTLATDPALHRMLFIALRCMPEERRARAAVCHELLLLAESLPHWAAVLCFTGGLGSMISWLRTLLMMPTEMDMLAVTLVCCAMNAVQGVKRGGMQVQDALRSARPGAPKSQHAAAVTAALAALDAAIPSSTAVHMGVHSRQHGLMGWLPVAMEPAHRLAAALLAYWQETGPLADARLAAARAAATRSCAYLRCANLGLAGGPAAGRGCGCLKCGKCRAVWYCGTGCSHADWAAGHRKACKELGAERLRERQQQQEQRQREAL